MCFVFPAPLPDRSRCSGQVQGTGVHLQLWLELNTPRDATEMGDPHVTHQLLMLVGTKPACKPPTDTEGCEAANRALLIALWLWTEGTKVTPISDVLISVLTASKHVLSFHIPELNGSAAASQAVPGICARITGKPEGLAACYSNKLASPQSGRLSFTTGSLCKV